MEGFSTLDPTRDKVIVFYTKNSNKISIELSNEIAQSKTQVDWINVESGHANSLDFQLVSYMGYLIASAAKESYIIVSKDNGFNAVISFWAARNVSVLLADNLLRETSDSRKQELKALIPDFPKDVDFVWKCIEKYKTKMGLNNGLVKQYGNDKAGKIYKSIKPLIQDKKSQ